MTANWSDSKSRQGPHLTLNPLLAASGFGNQTSKRAIAMDIEYLIIIVLVNEKDMIEIMTI